jgi:hypothetical protein
MHRIDIILELEVDGAAAFASPLVSTQYVDHVYPIRQSLPAAGSGGAAYDVFQMLQGGTPRVVILRCAEQITVRGLTAVSDTFTVRAGGILALVNIKAGFQGAHFELTHNGTGYKDLVGLVGGVN